jgi:hypothetical protein
MDWSKFLESGQAPAPWYGHFLRSVRSYQTRDLVFIAGLALAAGIGFAVLWSRSGFKTTEHFEPAAITGALGVIAWAYLAANVRLGIVDLFAAELFTLCKAAAVGQFVPKLIEWNERGDAPQYPLVAQQDYMTAFNNNAKDLELLDGDVVKHVTTTYVYFKVLTDKLARLHSPSKVRSDSGSRYESDRDELLDTVYIAFVTFESARYALTAMIEDSTRQDECILAALLSELPAYLELLGQCADLKDQVRIARITGRRGAYERLLDELRRRQPPSFVGGEELLTEILSLWDTRKFPRWTLPSEQLEIGRPAA